MLKLKKNGTSLKYNRDELYNVQNDRFTFTEGEELIGAYNNNKGYLLITNKKFLFVNVSKTFKDYTPIPYTKMQFCSPLKKGFDAVVNVRLNMMQGLVITLRYGVNDVDSIIQAYTYQNSTYCVIQKDSSLPPVFNPSEQAPIENEQNVFITE